LVKKVIPTEVSDALVYRRDARLRGARSVLVDLGRFRGTQLKSAMFWYILAAIVGLIGINIGLAPLIGRSLASAPANQLNIRVIAPSLSASSGIHSR
jgi:hypothetical protein